MRRLPKALIGAAIAVLTGCTSTPVRTNYQVFMPSDNLLTVRPTPKPPLSPQDYSLLSSWDQKEKVWADYAAALVGHIGLDKADKEGLRLWKSDIAEKVKQLNEANK